MLVSYTPLTIYNKTNKKSKIKGNEKMKKTNKQQTNKENQTKEINEGKKYLQNEILLYTQDKDTTHLYNVAYIIVKKTCFHYSMTSTQGQTLYTHARYKYTQNQDIQDLKQQCIYAILQELANNEKDPNKIIKNAFSGVNTYLYHLRSIKLSCRPFEYSIEELTENGIQLVNVHSGICKLVKENEYFDSIDTDTENEKRIQDRQKIFAILKELTPLQKQIVKMLALNMGQHQIANKMKRNIKTINEHIQAIRKKANKIINK